MLTNTEDVYEFEKGRRVNVRVAGHSFSTINHARHGLAVKQREERRALAAQRPHQRKFNGISLQKAK